MLAFIIGLVAGAASPTQASVNTGIRSEFRSPYITTILNFIVAGSLLALLILVTERSLMLPLGAVAHEPIWIWLGGAFGTTIVLLNIICVPKLGSARNVMLICFGQIMTGLIVDHFGMFGSPVVPMSMTRLAGAILVIIGIALVNGVIRAGKSTNDSAPSDAEKSGLVLYVILAIICGFACAAQVAVNGTLKTVTESALKATLISMIVGLITSVLVSLIVLALKGKKGLFDEGIIPEDSRWKFWMISGGALAIVIVGGNAIAAPLLGTGMVTILNLIGMMAAGLAIDATGFMGIQKKPVTLINIAGMLLMLAGTALISLL